VGSTSRSAKQRQSEHLHYLRRGSHHSKLLQRAYEKYGEDALTFCIAEIVEDDNFLLAREQFHIWRMCGKDMNSAPVSDSIYAAHAANRGRVMSEEERSARSIALKRAHKNYDYSDRATDERRGALREAWVKRKAEMRPDERIPTWIEMYLSGKSVREIAKATGAARATVIKNLQASNAYQKGKKYERTDEAKIKAVANKLAWVVVERETWRSMHLSGLSIREIHAQTGRSRKLIARELKKMEVIP